MKLRDFTEEKDFIELEMGETIADLEDNEIFFNPAHVDISEDYPVNLVIDGSVVHTGTWAEMVDYIAHNWGKLQGEYTITRKDTGSSVYQFKVVR